MEWKVEYTNEFEDWWEGLDENEQDSIAVCVALLENKVRISLFLTVQGFKDQNINTCGNFVFSTEENHIVFYMQFDPRRTAILLIGGNKAGDDRWYNEFVPLAEKIYDEHLRILKKEDLM